MSHPVILITGAARRIGAEIAKTFHQTGYNVALHYNHSAGEAESLANQLNHSRKNSAAVFQADLTDILAIKKMANAVYQWQERLDVLVNNASCFYPTPLPDASETDWDNLIGSNLKGPYFLSQALADQLRSSRACIINIADIHGRQPLKNHSIYCIAKAGNLMLTKSLAGELAPDVRVNGIAPGAILWPETNNGTDDNLPDKQSRQKIIDKIPLARTGSPEDIARMALFLAQSAKYITGHIINVDGGRSLSA